MPWYVPNQDQPARKEPLHQVPETRMELEKRAPLLRAFTGNGGPGVSLHKGRASGLCLLLTLRKSALTPNPASPEPGDWSAHSH